MQGLKTIRTSTRTPSIKVSSGLHPVTLTANLNATAEALFATAVAASATRVSLDRMTNSRLLSSRARRPRWVRVMDALSVEGIAAERGRAPRPPVDAANAASVVEALPAHGQVEAPKAETPDVAAPPAGGLREAAAVPQPKPMSGTSRVELTIDSLRTYELVKPIPVFVESLGERHYVAEVPDLNITTSASSLSEILIVLKDSVTQTYDDLRIRRNLDPQQARQLKMLERYIGKSKRGWLERR